ncbi:uncharacterized protein SCDLUD_001664 [Saccharomycodes ludwigii]|uniref:uncharacterized protein n=1 Tax=Saccharomycodes ludwigii TaxID=36035 RepID=UPI001E8566EB|nr:hypothetical protein SCDLUD_001664 [Saccharomycodes ludwigii]KAH3901880.1 hypothetical protein SCDLUD_001664 [Saccharomycodes ludwigii]
MCDDELLLKNEECSRNTILLKKYILLCRSILIDVLKPKGMPNLSQHMLKISDFLDENFLKLSNYMDEVKCNIVEPFDYLLIVPVLDKFLTFAYFQCYVFDNKSVQIENDIVRCSLILIGISACFINMCLKYEQNHIKPVVCEAKSNIVLGEGLKSIAGMRSKLLLFHLLRRCEHDRLDSYKMANVTDLHVQQEIDSFELATITCKTTKELSTRTIFNLFCSASEKLLKYEISTLQQLTTMHIHFTYQIILEKIVVTFLVTNYRYLTLLNNHNNSLTTFAFNIAKNDKKINILSDGAGYSEEAGQTIVDTNDNKVSPTLPFSHISNDTVFDEQFYQYFNCSETEFFDLLNSDLKGILPE